LENITKLHPLLDVYVENTHSSKNVRKNIYYISEDTCINKLSNEIRLLARIICQSKRYQRTILQVSVTHGKRITRYTLHTLCVGHEQRSLYPIPLRSAFNSRPFDKYVHGNTIYPVWARARAREPT